MSAAPIVDEQVWNGLKTDVGSAFAAELARIFLEEAPSMLTALETARNAANGDALRRAAHSLKSNALTFGAALLAQHARAVELGGLDSADEPALQRLRAALAATVAQLRQHTNGL